MSYERRGAAAVVTIDRPERRNAVDGPTAQLGEATGICETRDHAERVQKRLALSSGDQKSRISTFKKDPAVFERARAAIHTLLEEPAGGGA